MNKVTKELVITFHIDGLGEPSKPYQLIAPLIDEFEPPCSWRDYQLYLDDRHSEIGDFRTTQDFFNSLVYAAVGTDEAFAVAAKERIIQL